MLEKALEYKLSQLREKIIKHQFYVNNWKAKELVYVEPVSYKPVTHKIQKVTQMSKESVVTETSVYLPADMANEKIYIHIPVEQNSNMEALLFLNNHPVAGIDQFHTAILLPTTDSSTGAANWDIRVEGKMTIGEWKSLEQEIYLFTAHTEIEKYYFDLVTAYEVYQNSEDMSLKMNLRKLIENSISEFNVHSQDFEIEIKKGQQVLTEGLRNLNQTYNQPGKIALIAHSHLDVAWHWELKETVRKCARTFSTALNLMREYPAFRFPSSQVQLYDYMKKYCPQIYSQIKDQVKSGKWELIGGSWVESDCNLPGGESLVRQHLFGQRFFKKEFGKTTTVAWLPDTFGFSGNLPQILAGCGLRYFFTWKMYWQSRDTFPYNLFWWEGIDGSRLLAHLPRLISGYGGCATPHELFSAWKNFSEKDLSNEMMSTYGYGDGGGGVTREMVEYARRFDRFPGFIKCKMERADKFFKRIHRKVKNNSSLPVWKGELYLETHRGTFISKAILKALNRKTENLLLNAEKIASFLIANEIEPDLTGLEKAWKKVLLNQFHDIIAGTSEKEVNTEAVGYYHRALAIGNRIIENNMNKLTKVIDTSGKSYPVVLFNTLSWDRNDLVEIQLNNLTKNIDVIDETGEELDCQVINEKENKILVFVRNIPSLGYKVVDIKKKRNASGSNSIKISNTTLENDFYRIVINQSGELKIHDKIRNRDVFANGKWGNVLEFFRENPDFEEAWNIDRDFEKQRECIEDAVISVVETGPVRATVRIEKQYNKSIIVQEIRIYKDIPRIDFMTKVDWKERNVMLKASFPVNVNSLNATYEIPYGNIERPTHTNTSWEQEKFEVPAQKWADLSEYGFGVSILNDSKYSYDIRNNQMRITLLRSPNYPEFDADRGVHEFCYSLITHGGDWRKGGTTRQAYQLNFPVIARRVKPNQGKVLLPALVNVDSENIIIEVVKKSEDSDDMIIRLYEYFGARRAVNLSLGFKVKEAYETDMLENNKRKVKVTNGARKLSFFIKPYEIKTFRLTLDK